MKNVPNITRMHNFPFWQQQDLCFIYQFWKQPTSNPYSLFFAVKKNSFIHSIFHISFFLCPFLTKTKQYFSTNQRAKMTNHSTTRNFLYFCINFIQFKVIFAASYIVIANQCHFNIGGHKFANNEAKFFLNSLIR